MHNLSEVTNFDIDTLIAGIKGAEGKSLSYLLLFPPFLPATQRPPRAEFTHPCSSSQESQLPTCNYDQLFFKNHKRVPITHLLYERTKLF
jgi:hypothetical protein